MGAKQGKGAGGGGGGGRKPAQPQYSFATIADHYRTMDELQDALRRGWRAAT